MEVVFIHAGAFILVLVALAFIAGGMSRLKNHNVVQDAVIEKIKESHSTDIYSIKDKLADVEKDIETITAGQARMYSDFKGTLEQALKPVIDSNNRQAERLDRVLEMFAQQGGAKR